MTRRWSWTADLKKCMGKTCFAKRDKKRQWLISKESRQTGSKTSCFVPPLGFQEDSQSQLSGSSHKQAENNWPKMWRQHIFSLESFILIILTLVSFGRLMCSSSRLMCDMCYVRLKPKIKNNPFRLFLSNSFSNTSLSSPAAKFIVPDGGNKVNSGVGLSYWPTRLHGWRAGTTTPWRSQLYRPVRDYEFGYWSVCILLRDPIKLHSVRTESTSLCLFESNWWLRTADLKQWKVRSALA